MCFSNDDLPSRFLLLAQMRFPTARICPCLGTFACSFAVVRLLFHLTVLIFCFTCDLVLEFFLCSIPNCLQNCENASVTNTVPGLGLVFLGKPYWTLYGFKNSNTSFVLGWGSYVKTLRPVNLENDQLRPTCTLFLS